jgi:hypothetical protein
MKVALYKGKRGGFAGAFDASVRWWTRGPYSHVELVFSDGMSASASARDGGVRFKRIDFKPEHWDFIDLSVDEEHLRTLILKRLEQESEQNRQIADNLAKALIAQCLTQVFDEKYARAFFEERRGLRYDYFGLFGFVWRPHSGSALLWFCSEIVMGALKFDDPWQFNPNMVGTIARRLTAHRAMHVTTAK